MERVPVPKNPELFDRVIANIQKLAHIRMDFGGIMQSVWNRMGYVALYHILPLAAFSRF